MLIWCDPLYPLLVFPEGDNMPALLERSRRSRATLAPFANASLPCRYAAALFDVCILKGEMLQQLRDRYLANDRPWLEDAARNRIPALHAAYEHLMRCHRTLWERDNRRFGWEVLSLRYGGAMARLMDVQDELLRYLNGELSCIEELDAEPKGLIKAHNHSLYCNISMPPKDVWQIL